MSVGLGGGGFGPKQCDGVCFALREASRLLSVGSGSLLSWLALVRAG